jgi:hypothetical protein
MWIRRAASVTLLVSIMARKASSWRWFNFKALSLIHNIFA